MNPTRLLAGECARLGIPVLVNASAVGYYGRTRTEIVTERAPPGDTFLAELCAEWEAATAVAREADVRVVNLRTGLVLGQGRRPAAQADAADQLCSAARLGSGKQYWPWISVTDEIAAIIHLLTAPVHGPVNLTGPYPVTNAEFTKELGRALHRPAPWIVPGFALHIVLGEFARGIWPAKGVPTVLHESGFEFAHRTLPEALAAEMA